MSRAKLLGIKRALVLWASFCQEKLIIEGDLVNAIKWARSCKTTLGIGSMVREIRALCSGRDVSFEQVHVQRS